MHRLSDNLPCVVPAWGDDLKDWAQFLRVRGGAAGRWVLAGVYSALCLVWDPNS